MSYNGNWADNESTSHNNWIPKKRESSKVPGEFVVVTELPEKGEGTNIYLIPKIGGGYIEYIWANNEWDEIGDTEIDLSEYKKILTATPPTNPSTEEKKNLYIDGNKWFAWDATNNKWVEVGDAWTHSNLAPMTTKDIDTAFLEKNWPFVQEITLESSTVPEGGPLDFVPELDGYRVAVQTGPVSSGYNIGAMPLSVGANTILIRDIYTQEEQEAFLDKTYYVQIADVIIEATPFLTHDRDSGIYDATAQGVKFEYNGARFVLCRFYGQSLVLMETGHTPSEAFSEETEIAVYETHPDLTEIDKFLSKEHLKYFVEKIPVIKNAVDAPDDKSEQSIIIGNTAIDGITFTSATNDFKNNVLLNKYFSGHTFGIVRESIIGGDRQKVGINEHLVENSIILDQDNTVTSVSNAYINGYSNTVDNSSNSVISGGNNTINNAPSTLILGVNHQVNGGFGVVVGSGNKVLNNVSGGSVTGYLNTISGNYAHAEGYSVTSSGEGAHAEGGGTAANGNYSHAEGFGNIAKRTGAHAEGSAQTKASGAASHAEGWGSKAYGPNSHAEGMNSVAGIIADDNDSVISNGPRAGMHAEGYATVSSGGFGSHSEGYQTLASGEAQHVQGRYNIEDANSVYAHIVGNGTGTSASERSNAHTLDWNGNAWYAGKVTMGADPVNPMDAVPLKMLSKESLLTLLGYEEKIIQTKDANGNNITLKVLGVIPQPTYVTIINGGADSFQTSGHTAPEPNFPAYDTQTMGVNYMAVSGKNYRTTIYNAVLDGQNLGDLTQTGVVGDSKFYVDSYNDMLFISLPVNNHSVMSGIIFSCNGGVSNPVATYSLACNFSFDDESAPDFSFSFSGIKIEVEQ